MHKKEMAKQILETIGGKENIANVFRCMTRLRFNLKDNGLADLDMTNKIDGVIGVQVCSGEIQITISHRVETLYNEVLKITGIEYIDQINDLFIDDIQDTKKKWTCKSVVNEIMNMFSACMSPLIPLFVIVGVSNMIATIIGPQLLNLVDTQSDIYINFYYVSQSILYFLPIFIAYTASKHVQCNTYISLTIAGFMLYPQMTEIIMKSTPFSIFGISMPLVDYSSSIIPMIFIPWVQAYVEKVLNRYIPDVIKVILIPCGTMLVMLLIGLCLLGPIGNYIGVYLSDFITWLYNVAGPVETAFIGSLCVLSIMFGFSKPIFIICLSTMMATGVEYTYLPIAMVVGNYVMLGALLGYIFNVKNTEKKQFGITCFVSLFIGGVSEPAVYGVFLNHKPALIATAMAGAISGYYLGIMKVGYYVFGPSSFLSVMGFLGGPSSNFMHGCIASAIAFISAFVLMMVLSKKKKIEY